MPIHTPTHLIQRTAASTKDSWKREWTELSCGILFFFSSLSFLLSFLSPVILFFLLHCIIASSPDISTLLCLFWQWVVSFSLFSFFFFEMSPLWVVRVCFPCTFFNRFLFLVPLFAFCESARIVCACLRLSVSLSLTWVSLPRSLSLSLCVHNSPWIQYTCLYLCVIVKNRKKKKRPPPHTKTNDIKHTHVAGSHAHSQYYARAAALSIPFCVLLLLCSCSFPFSLRILRSLKPDCLLRRRPFSYLLTCFFFFICFS